MIFVVKRVNIIIIAVIFCVSVAAYGIYVGSTQTAGTVSSSLEDKTIVIDAGHGGEDPGVVSKNGTLEKDLNLAIAQKLQKKFEKSNVVMTRTEDISTMDRDLKSYKKRSDLNNRVRAMKDGDIFVSIHINRFEQAKYKGAQVFYSKNSEKSKSLADFIQESLVKNVDPENKRIAAAAQDSIFVLKAATIPSVVVECGFISNPEEEKLLLSDGYQQKIADAIYLGISNYFNGTPSSQTQKPSTSDDKHPSVDTVIPIEDKNMEDDPNMLTNEKDKLVPNENDEVKDTLSNQAPDVNKDILAPEDIPADFYDVGEE